MGRVKLQLKKIENKTYRHITFAKRKSGLVKKAYEISTLCDIEIVLIIFSPAGKLILFDGKKRVEEILTHFIDLPEHRRGWLQNQEAVQQFISQLRLEADIYHQAAMSGKEATESESEDAQNEMHMYSSQLEDVEKQLQYYLKSSSGIKTVSEAEHREWILEETLMRVRNRKQVLEADHNKPISALQFGALDCQLTANPSCGSFMGSSNYNFNWSPQLGPQMPMYVMDSNVVLHPLRNQLQSLDEFLTPTSTFYHGYPSASGNVYKHQMQVGQISHPGLGQWINTSPQGGASHDMQESEEACYGNCSHDNCGKSFPI